MVAGNGLSLSPASCLSVFMIRQLVPAQRIFQERKRKPFMSKYEMPLSSLPPYLFVRSKSLCPAHTQGEKKLNSTSWREEFQRLYVQIFNSPQSLSHRNTAWCQDCLSSGWLCIFLKKSPTFPISSVSLPIYFSNYSLLPPLFLWTSSLKVTKDLLVTIWIGYLNILFLYLCSIWYCYLLPA